MAKLVYAPVGEDRQEWDFDLDRLTGDQLILLEDTLDMTVTEWQALLERGSMKAMLALCWLMRRETDEHLSWSDAKKIQVGALSVDVDEDEEAPKAETPSPAEDSPSITGS